MTYFPGNGPAVDNAEVSKMLQYIDQELKAISQAFAEAKVLELRVSFAPPTKPRDGEIRYADGTSWNPGSGEGIYGRVAGSWVKLHV